MNYDDYFYESEMQLKSVYAMANSFKTVNEQRKEKKYRHGEVSQSQVTCNLCDWRQWIPGAHMIGDLAVREVQVHWQKEHPIHWGDMHPEDIPSMPNHPRNHGFEL